MILLLYDAIRNVWKSMKLNKPRVIGEFSPQDMAKIIAESNEIEYLASDFFIRMYTGKDPGKGGSTMEILQGDLKLTEWFSSSLVGSQYLKTNLGSD